jgi:hypothetical protein
MKRWLFLLLALWMYLSSTPIPNASNGSRAADRTVPQAPAAVVKVLFDETHGVVSDPWHGPYSIDEAYRDWADRLRQRGYQVSANQVSLLTLAVLSEYHVCVIALPTQSLAPSEVTALQEYVAAGGGLLLLPDAFGGGTGLNVVSQAFGITISSDVLADWDDSRPIRPFHFFFHTWPAAGSLTAYVDVVMYDWGSSLTLEAPAEPFGTGDQDTWAESDGNGQFDPGELAGFPVGMARSTYGSGKVVVIGDANLFMNMYSEEFDNAQLSSNVIDWLAGGNPAALDPNLVESQHFKLSVPDEVLGDQSAILQKLEESYDSLGGLYGGDTRYTRSKVELEPTHPGCRSGCTNCIYNIWSDLSDPYLQGQPLIPRIYQPLLAELGHIYSGKYLGPLWMDTQYQWLGEGLGNWWTVPALNAIGYPQQASGVNNWISWAGEEYQRRGYTWISQWNQNNPNQDRDLGYGMSCYIVRQLDQQYGTAMWHRLFDLFDLIGQNERRLLTLTDDQKNSYAVCLFNQAANDPTLIDVFTQQWHFQTDSLLWTSPTGLTFAHPYGASAQYSREVGLTNCSNRQTLTWTATISPTTTWFSVDRSSGQTPGNIQIRVDASGLVTGTYGSALQFATTPNSLSTPVTLPITLMVGVHQVYMPAVFKGQ